MADNITIVEGRELFAANWDRGHPWHRLGPQLTHDMTPWQALQLSGSDDHVYPVTLYDAENATTLEELADVEDLIGIKSDKYGVMGYASPTYEIFQRREILELAYSIVGLAKEDAHIDTIGNLGEKAQKFFAYIRVPDLVIDPNGIADTIERGLFVGTSFNRTLPNIIGYSLIRVLCENTLNMALRAGLQQAIRVPHTRNAEARMRQAAEALGYAGAVEEVVVKRAEEMLRVDGDKALNNVLNGLFPITEDLGQTARTRRERIRGDIHMLYDGPDNTNVDKVGRNGWAAYNAAVEWSDHARTVKGKNRGVVRSEQNVIPGPVTEKKIKVSELVLAAA